MQPGGTAFFSVYPYTDINCRNVIAFDGLRAADG